MSEETRDIATKQGGAIATLDFVSDSGMGLENVDKQDLALPFLKLLQSGSDETKKKHAKYVEGAEAGMFYIEHTKIIFDLAIKIAAPILLFVFLNNSFLAMLSKLAPNMNVFFSVGFQVSMMGGLVIFFLIIPHFLELSQLLLNDYMRKLLDLLTLMK